MEELRKCYKKLDELMKEIENRHDTDIMDFINLDDEVKAECMGDWTEKDVQSWEYLADRISTIQKAYDIMREELHLGEFLPEINKQRKEQIKNRSALLNKNCVQNFTVKCVIQ